MESQNTAADIKSASSVKTTPRKSTKVTTNKFSSRIEEQKNTLIVVHARTPHLESQVRRNTDPIYQGEVNVLSVIETNHDVMCCKYTEDVTEIAAGFTDGTIRVFDVSSGRCTHTLVDDECRSYPGPVMAIKHRPVSDIKYPTNMLLSCYVNGCIKCWKYKSDTCLYTIREKRQTLGLSYHPRFPKFVSFGGDSKLNMYDEGAQTQQRSFYSNADSKSVGHTSPIFACVFNPKSQHELISGGWDNHVICWDDRQPNPTRHFYGVHICGEGLDFDKPGREILACSWQAKGSIQIWDYGSCKLIETITPDNCQCKLYCGKFVPDTNLLVCAGSDSNILRVVDKKFKLAWRYGSCKLIETITPDNCQCKLYCGKFVPDTNLPVCAGSDSNILRVVDKKFKLTECSIRNNPGGIHAFDFGRIRRKAKVRDTYKIISEIQLVPRVVFASGRRIHTVDFG